MPCPRETLRMEGAFGPLSRHKASCKAAGGQLLFPFLVDRTANVALNESSEIVRHLWRRYGSDVERPAVDELLNGEALPTPLSFALLVSEHMHGKRSASCFHTARR